MSEEDKERLHEHRGTLLDVLVSAIKISFATTKAVQKSLSSVCLAISSSWLMFEELKFLISTLSNIGMTLYNIRQFEEAPKVLEVCCQTVWVYVRQSYCRLSTITEGDVITEVLPKDTLKDIIVDAFMRIAKMVDVLHRCGAKVKCEIVVKSLLLLVDGDMSEYLSGSLALIKLWVKAKFFGQHCSSQEELAFGSMEPQEEYFLERSRVLIRKAGVLRSSGMQNISSCLEFLSKAILLLAEVLGNARSALDWWAKLETSDHSSPSVIFQQLSKTVVPLVCSMIDLMSIKVAMIHELISNAAEAEVLLQTGKEISHFHRLPVLHIAFTSLLDGDFQEQLTGNLSSALCIYQSIIEKLDNTQFLEGISDCHKPGCDKDCIAKTKCEAYNHGKEPLSAKDDVLPTCIICVLLRQASIDHCNEQAILNSRTKNSEARPPLDSKVKSGSRYPLCSAKEQNVETRVKTSELSKYFTVQSELCSSALTFATTIKKSDVCCIFSTVGMSCVVPWLLKAFVLSGESPSLFQKISIGTLSCHYLASLQGSLTDSIYETNECASKLLSEFFDKLPDVPIVCISMLGDDYVDVIEKNLCSFFPAWMLLSRFDSKSKPTTMLLPAVALLEEMQFEGSIKDLVIH
ncbi:unnamed protein product [Miscanthus lutarioriparius]|uniref:Uncharacterized protein n=1 Tax=Miscanthus lutarioriparius TaxID=422564 RepID=A0A811S2T5_9POAL|nr:unnamed protein product [Miscanthus lutarioriparius]